MANLPAWKDCPSVAIYPRKNPRVHTDRRTIATTQINTTSTVCPHSCACRMPHEILPAIMRHAECPCRTTITSVQYHVGRSVICPAEVSIFGSTPTTMTIAEATASAGGGDSKSNNRVQSETPDFHQNDRTTKFVPSVKPTVTIRLTKQSSMSVTTTLSSTRSRSSSLTDVEQKQRVVRRVRNSKSRFLFSVALATLLFHMNNALQLSSQLGRPTHRGGGGWGGQQSVVRGIQQSLVDHHRSSTSGGATKISSLAATRRTSFATPTCLSMSLVPLPVEDLQELIVTGVPSGDQYATYFGRTKREKYSKYIH